MKTMLPFRRGTWLPMFVVLALTVFLPSPGFSQSVPNITQQPQSQTVIAGTNASFTVIATGQAPLTYKWLFNGANLTNNFQIGGAAKTTFNLTNATGNNGGEYQGNVYDPDSKP